MKPIELQGFTVVRGGFTLDIPRLEVEPGTVVGLVGRNGAGKTTLLETLVGLHAPSRGTVRVLGMDPIDDLVAVRQRTALMTDDMPVFALTAGALLRSLAPFYPTWDGALAADLLRRFEIDPRQAAGQMSKGEGTRLRLVLSLAFRPSLLLLDEPATGLDVPSRRRMLAEVLEVVKDPQRTVVVSSHQVNDVERIADRIVLLDRGRVLADGTPAQVCGEGRTLEDVLAGAAL